MSIKTSRQKGNDRSPESNAPRSICPKTLGNLSPTQIMLHIKFDQDWPTGFRDIEVQMCEIFVTQGQVTPYWAVWFGPKSKSTELLCLSWLPETLKMIWSKMNQLARRHHLPITSLYEKFFRFSRAANSVVSGPIWPKFDSSEILCISSLPASTKGSNQKQPRKGGDTIFPIIRQLGLSVAMDTRVLIQYASKHYAAFPHPSDATHKIWSRLANWPQRYSSSEV